MNALRLAMMPDCLSMLCRTSSGLGHAFVKFEAVGLLVKTPDVDSVYLMVT